MCQNNEVKLVADLQILKKTFDLRSLVPADRYAGKL